MGCPIVFVHGIGSLRKDRDWYFKSWIHHFGVQDFSYFNASWHSEAFNVVYGPACEGPGFTELAGMKPEDLSSTSFMARLLRYSRAKAEAVAMYSKWFPFGRHGPVAWFNKKLYDFVCVKVVDYVGDVFAYMDWEQYTSWPLEVGNPIRNLVEYRLTEALIANPGRPIHIVSHSLGTKIIWDILSERKLPEGTIGVWFTMGSPIQPMKVFRLTRDGDKESFRKPACVDHWVNIYDIKDPIGAPIGGPSFKTPTGTFRTMKEVLRVKDLYPCVNVCADVGWFPWTAHLNYFSDRNVKRLFEKYVTKYTVPQEVLDQENQYF